MSQRTFRVSFAILFTFASLTACGVTSVSARAQGAPPAGGQQPGGQGGRQRGGGMQNMPRVTGEVTAIAGPTITVKAEDGTVTQVVTTDNTRVMKSNGMMGMGGGGGQRGGAGGGAPETIKVADIKVGDGAMAAGQMDDAKALHAMFLVVTDASVVKAMKENMGKTYIAGKVASIDLDNAKMVVTRTDGVSQTIAFDENTSFKRGGRGGGGQRGGGGAAGGGAAAPTGGESITLADVKVGDTVMGQGAVKNGTFVPGQLMVSSPRGAGGPGAGGPPAGAPPAQ